MQNLTILEAVFRVVCDQYDISKEELKGPHQNRAISHPRHVAMGLMRDVTRGPLSYPKIAHHLNRDASTVQSGVKRIRKISEADLVFRNEYNDLLAKVNALASPPPFIRSSNMAFKSRRVG